MQVEKTVKTMDISDTKDWKMKKIGARGIKTK